jgi:hypothetical protein
MTVFKKILTDYQVYKAKKGKKNKQRKRWVSI